MLVKEKEIPSYFKCGRTSFRKDGGLTLEKSNFIMRLMVKFNNPQLKALSGICADIGQVLLASAVVPFIFGFDKISPPVLTSGLGGTLVFWLLSIILLKGGKR